MIVIATAPVIQVKTLQGANFALFRYYLCLPIIGAVIETIGFLWSPLVSKHLQIYHQTKDSRFNRRRKSIFNENTG